jgi:hypothetical protein
VRRQVGGGGEVCIMDGRGGGGDANNGAAEM